MRKIKSAVATLAVLAGVLVPLLAAGTANAASAWGPIYNYGASTCLDDPGSSHSSGTQMDSWGCNGGANQQWRVFASRLQDNQFEQYVFQNEASGLCLDMRGGSSANGTPVIQWPCNTKDNAQWWEMGNPNVNYSPPWFTFLNDASISYMVISSDSHTWGAKLEGWRPSNLFSDTNHWWDPSGCACHT
jgi:hypothetical protein